MGFGGGNTGSLPDHDHDPLVSNDGGTLNANATSFNLSSGSLLYSDGSNVQELAVGSASDELRVSAGNVPEWYTPGAATSTWTELANVTNGVVQNLESGTFSHYDQLQVWCWRENNTSSSTGFIFNSTGAGGQYSSHYFTDFTSDEDYATVGAVIINGSYNTQNLWFIKMDIINLAGEEKLCTWNAVLGNGAGNQNLGTSFGTAKTTFTTDITSIQCTGDSGAVSNQKAGSRMIVLGASP